MAAGTIVYCVTMALGITAGGIHQILIGIGASLICMLIGGWTGKSADREVLNVYFPEA